MERDAVDREAVERVAKAAVERGAEANAAAETPKKRPSLDLQFGDAEELASIAGAAAPGGTDADLGLSVVDAKVSSRPPATAVSAAAPMRRPSLDRKLSLAILQPDEAAGAAGASAALEGGQRRKSWTVPWTEAEAEAAIAQAMSEAAAEHPRRRRSVAAAGGMAAAAAAAEEARATAAAVQGEGSRSAPVRRKSWTESVFGAAVPPVTARPEPAAASEGVPPPLLPLPPLPPPPAAAAPNRRSSLWDRTFGKGHSAPAAAAATEAEAAAAVRALEALEALEVCRAFS